MVKLPPYLNEGRAGLLYGESYVHHQVRILLGTDWDFFPIKVELVKKIDEGIHGDSWNTWCVQFCVELMGEYGPEKVLFALSQLKDELDRWGLDMPNFYRLDIPNSSVNLALTHFQDFLDDQLRREVEEEQRQQQWRDFFDQYLP